MSSDFQWKASSGEWQFSGNSARESTGHGTARSQAPSTDFIFSARITPDLHEEPQLGVVFRGDASGKAGYVFRSRQRGIFLLAKHSPDGGGEMAGRVRLPVDESYILTVLVVGWRIRCFVDGRKVFDVTDGSPIFGDSFGLTTLTTGGLYEDIHVEAITEENLKKHLQALARQGIARREHQYGYRCHVIDLKGRSGFLNVGDLDGDGKMDFVTTQGSKYLTAVTREGEILWKLDNPKGQVIMHPECQVPTTIVDIDGDGANEVICRWYRDGQEMLFVLDGRTGAIKHEKRWDLITDPDGTAPDPPRGTMCHMVIANLRGRALPQDILVTNEQWGLYAFTDTLELLWSIPREDLFQKNLPWLCHHPAVEDLDDDGCDEVCTGGMLLDQDGSILWAKDLEAETGDSHVDSVKIADVDMNAANGKEIAFSTGACLLNAKGEYYWRYLPLVTHGQNMWVGKVRADVPGLQILVLDAARYAPGTYLFSAKGEFLLKLPAGLIYLADWDGDGLDEIACDTKIYDATGNILADLPVAEVHTAYGYDSTGGHFMAADVMGDAREEIIWTSGDLIVIFENTAPNQNPPLQLSPAQKQARWKEIYNTTRY